MVHIINYYYTL